MSNKLTLSIDPAVEAAAKRYAAANDTSVSRLVERYLAAVTGFAAGSHPSTQLQRWRGSMPEGEVEDHKDWLRRKYGV